MIYFDSDYMEGAHPEVMRRLVETNLEHTVGYGCDPYTQQAKEAIRAAKANKTRSAIHAIDDDEDDDVVLPPIRSRYGEDDGVDEPTPPPTPAKRETNLNGMASNVSKGTVKKNTNKSKKHNKKK